MNIILSILDRIKHPQYYYTLRSIKRLKRIDYPLDRITKAWDVINHISKGINPSACDTPVYLDTSWESFYDMLAAYADRWTSNRINYCVTMLRNLYYKEIE